MPEYAFIDTEDIIDCIREELDHATDKSPWWPSDPIHGAAIVQEEAGELIQAALQWTYEPEKHKTRTAMHAEAVQVAAMAVRFCVSIMKYKRFSENQHQQD